MCVVYLLDICSYLLAHLNLPMASPDLVMSVSQSEPREIWLLKINQSEPKIGHRLSPVGSQHSYKNMFIGSRVRGERRTFSPIPFRCGLDMSSLECSFTEVKVELTWLIYLKEFLAGQFCILVFIKYCKRCSSYRKPVVACIPED